MRRAALYKTHQEAREEHAAWRREIEQLRAKNNQTLALLERIAALIRQYDAELQACVAKMSVYEIETQLDEALMAQQERLDGRSGCEQLDLIQERLEDGLTRLHEEARRYAAAKVQYAQEVRPLFDQLRLPI